MTITHITPREQELMARVAEIEKAQTWRTIESAPKTGEESLFRTEELGQVVMYWGDEDGWCTGFNYPDNLTPTHWMPLPPPPAIDDAMQLK